MRNGVAEVFPYVLLSKMKEVLYGDLMIDSTPLGTFWYEAAERIGADKSRNGGMEEAGGLEQETRESMSVDEVKAYLENHFTEIASSRNKGQLMKAAMSALKGKADAKTISEAAAQLCRQEI